MVINNRSKYTKLQKYMMLLVNIPNLTSLSIQTKLNGGELSQQLGFLSSYALSAEGGSKN
jgi:hypothetical protein